MECRSMDVHRFSPLRPLDWRWRYAQQVVGDEERFRQVVLDQPTKVALDYLRSTVRGHDVASAARRFATLRVAHELHQRGGDTALVVQAHLLAGQPAAAISTMTGIPTPTLDLYEQLFFNIVDRLDARDWILFTAIWQGGWDPAHPTRETVLRQLGYFGGPCVLELAIPMLVEAQPWTRAFDPAVVDRARRLVSLLLTPEEPAFDWHRTGQRPTLTPSPARGETLATKQRPALEELLALLGGAVGERVAQREGDRGLGETAQPELLLPLAAGRGAGSQDLPGSRAGRAASCRRRPEAAGRAGPAQGERGPRTAAPGGGPGSGTAARSPGAFADGRRAAGHRPAAAEPTPLEALA